MALIIFWLAAGVILYTYLGYPLLMRLLALARPRAVKAADISPKITVIVAAFNEEKSIRAKLDSVLASDYPVDHLSVIVGSDSSTDRTDSIVDSYEDERVQLLRVARRLGKTNVQNACAARAEGEILIFTDATTLLRSDALRMIVRPFGDPDVGAAGGRVVYLQEGESNTGEGGVSYWEYENALRQWESDHFSQISVSGCFYAVRRRDYRPIPAELISDFVIALDLARRKRRVVLQPQAVCYERTLEGPSDEIQMRVRVILRSLVALEARKDLLNPFRFGMVAIALWSHKVLRYLLPVCFVAAIAALAVLADSAFYRVVLYSAIAIAAIATAGIVVSWKNRLAVMVGYLLLTNLASVIALCQFALGRNVVVWTPRR